MYESGTHFGHLDFLYQFSGTDQMLYSSRLISRATLHWRTTRARTWATSKMDPKRKWSKKSSRAITVQFRSGSSTIVSTKLSLTAECCATHCTFFLIFGIQWLSQMVCATYIFVWSPHQVPFGGYEQKKSNFIEAMLIKWDHRSRWRAQLRNK